MYIGGSHRVEKGLVLGIVGALVGLSQVYHVSSDVQSEGYEMLDEHSVVVSMYHHIVFHLYVLPYHLHIIVDLFPVELDLFFVVSHLLDVVDIPLVEHIQLLLQIGSILQNSRGIVELPIRHYFSINNGHELLVIEPQFVVFLFTSDISYSNIGKGLIEDHSALQLSSSKAPTNASVAEVKDISQQDSQLHSHLAQVHFGCFGHVVVVVEDTYIVYFHQVFEVGYVPVGHCSESVEVGIVLQEGYVDTVLQSVIEILALLFLVDKYFNFDRQTLADISQILSITSELNSPHKVTVPMGNYSVIGIVIVAMVVENVVVMCIHYCPVVELQVIATQFSVFQQNGQFVDGFNIDPEVFTDSVDVALEVPKLNPKRDKDSGE